MCRPGYDVPDLKSVNDDALPNGGEMEQCEAEVTYTSVTGHIDYKWKNHFSEMKGDVGMSLHEKEGEQEDA